MSHSTTTETNAPKRARTDANDAGSNQQQTMTNQAENSSPSEQAKSFDHKHIWKINEFTDEIDRQDFGSSSHEVKKLKYNDPTLTYIDDDWIIWLLVEYVGKEALIRLGWYFATNDLIEGVVCNERDYITDDVIKCMFSRVIWTPKTRIRVIDFSICSITTDGIKSLLPFIRAAPSITEFRINGNQIGTDGFALVVNALRGRPIKILSSYDCAIHDIVPALTDCTFPELEAYCFNDNPIGDEGAKCIADKLLQSAPKLKSLFLCNCGISDQGAQSIANALILNETLEELDLPGNNISIEGVASFAKALRSNHTLQHLDLTNSTMGWSNTAIQYKDLQFALKMNRYFQKDPRKAIRLAKEKGFAKGGDGLECAVCIEKKIEFFFFWPCGHKICTDCHDHYDEDICHMCKKEIEKRQRLY